MPSASTSLLELLPRPLTMPEHGTNLHPPLQELERMAADTFGSKEDAAQWLRRSNPMLDGEVPLQIAASPAGTQRVKAILCAIKYGGVL